MNTIKRAISVVTLVLLLASCAAASYYYFENVRLKNSLAGAQGTLTQKNAQSAEMQGSLNKLQAEFDKLKKDYDNISSDRSSLLMQSKGLLADRELARNLEQQVADLKKSLENEGLAKKDLLDKKLALEAKISDLENLQKQLVKENKDLASLLESERARSGVKRMETEIASLKKDNDSITEKLKKYLSDIEQLKASERALKGQARDLSDANKNLQAKLNDVIEKNKGLQKKVIDDPAKFTELARQHKALLRQTAMMHYNLGVFYTRQKEYPRAISELSKAVEIDPTDGQAHFNLGYIYAEYVVDRPKAVEHFRQYLRYAKPDDKDADWVKKYLVTWQAYDGKESMN